MISKITGMFMLLDFVTARRPDETVFSLVGSEHGYKASTSAELLNRIVTDISDYLEGEAIDRDHHLMVHGSLGEMVQPTNQLPLRTLNRHSFAENILQGTVLGDYVVEQWMVRFCPASWRECQWQEEFFEDLAGDWEAKLNTELSVRRVRFAMVDCATDKELCNAEGVMTYPTVHHYHNGKRLDVFDGGANDFASWLEQRLSVKKEEQQLQAEHLIHPNQSGVTFDYLQVAAMLVVNALTIGYNMHA
eukprot:CAMPEP_0172719490 /NCGR_PEP_ID=MMETSP1074-20121228/75534_1 /TAXON_ID=2916 /ORGANISM="Ceratium fusus, Strain PA161109" /LENGTH=246 /DNA_ID=CAMNT_0013544845 /DNA_START=146 /DNA_END=886 /DNA_ORIENTATION=+